MNHGLGYGIGDRNCQRIGYIILVVELVLELNVEFVTELVFGCCLIVFTPIGGWTKLWHSVCGRQNGQCYPARSNTTGTPLGTYGGKVRGTVAARNEEQRDEAGRLNVLSALSHDLSLPGRRLPCSPSLCTEISSSRLNRPSANAV